MLKRKIFLSSSMIIVLIFTLFVESLAQHQNRNNPNLLSKPKDIVYDAVRKLRYISNYDGNCIVRMDSIGNQEYMLQGINNPMGLHLCSDTLIIASNTPSKITALDVTNDSIIYELDVLQAEHLAMMDIDPRSGLIYIVEQLGAVFKLNYRVPTCNLYVPFSAGVHYGSQTLEVDTANNRLLVFKWDGGFIRAVDLNDSTMISNASPQLTSQIQASQRGPDGEIYVSSYINNGIYEYTPNLSSIAEITSGLQQPSGIAYNPDNHSLFVCNYGNNTISEIPLIPITIEEPAGIAIRLTVYPNPASERCHLQLTLKRSFNGLIRIVNTCGVILQSIPIDFLAGRSDHKVNTSNLPAGFYIIQVVAFDTIMATNHLMIIK